MKRSVSQKGRVFEWFQNRSPYEDPIHTDRDVLVEAGIDPDRSSHFHLGWPRELHFKWMPRFASMFALFVILETLQHFHLIQVNVWIESFLYLFVGLFMIQAACQALLQATIAAADRINLTHYVTASLGEIIATLPEMVVVGYLVMESPIAAFVLVMMTIYNNTLVFSFYSFFLPKNTRGRFLMPEPITDAGHQILIAGGALGLICGIWMMVAKIENHGGEYVGPGDLLGLGIAMLAIFVVYMIKLVRDYAEEEQQIESVLNFTEEEKELRREEAYEYALTNSVKVIVFIGFCGVVGAFIGGHSVAMFADIALTQLGLSDIVTAFLLAIFGGMSEYVILWSSHRKKEYGIALANAFGGITQVLFLLLPFTLIAISLGQWIAPSELAFPLSFSVPVILLLMFLFPTFYTLTALLAEDHTFGILDTTILTVIVLLLIVLMLTHT